MDFFDRKKKNPRKLLDKRATVSAIPRRGVVQCIVGFDHKQGERSKSCASNERDRSTKRLSLARDELYLRLCCLQNSDLDKCVMMSEIEKMTYDIDDLRKSIKDSAAECEMRIESQLRIIRSM